MLRAINQTTKKTSFPVNSEISRIVSAAVVNKRFCSTLLSNPVSALSHGYCGEPFSLSADQKNRIAMIKEDSLEEFAAKLALI
jgi:hypothetical protein